jgi:hypothetical protein
MEVSGILTHQTEEIDPCNVSLPESDDEVSCVGDPRVDDDANEDVLPLSAAGRIGALEIVKVRNHNLSLTLPD